MVARLLGLPGLPGKDAADALGLAVCHAHAGRSFAAIERATARTRTTRSQYKDGRSR
jgi:crossover junction endodeoxyribonuclease RuvC